VSAAVQLELPVQEVERPHVPPDAGRYLRTLDAPELCECQRPVDACECAQLFGQWC
jgi:hypothetical protein